MDNTLRTELNTPNLEEISSMASSKGISNETQDN